MNDNLYYVQFIIKIYLDHQSLAYIFSKYCGKSKKLVILCCLSTEDDDWEFSLFFLW
jgi:hypothetical protein